MIPPNWTPVFLLFLLLLLDKLWQGDYASFTLPCSVYTFYCIIRWSSLYLQQREMRLTSIQNHTQKGTKWRQKKIISYPDIYSGWKFIVYGHQFVLQFILQHCELHFFQIKYIWIFAQKQYLKEPLWDPSLDISWSFWIIYDHYDCFLKQFKNGLKTNLTPFETIFWRYLDHTWTIFWTIFRTLFEPFWNHCRNLFWTLFWTIFESYFIPFLNHLLN